MSQDPLKGFELRLIEHNDRVRGLKLGDAAFLPLKIFLEKHAKPYQKESLARTYGVFNSDGKIVAYITLVCGEIVIEDGEALVAAPDLQYDYRSYPAVKLARLAVDKSLQRKKLYLGRRLVEFGLGLTKESICPVIGCRFVVLDAKKQSVEFYKKCGFKLLDTPTNKTRDEPVMFLDLHKTEVK